MKKGGFPRELYQRLYRDLADLKPMIFLTGPRQAGKTTFAELIAKDYPDSLSFNYDNPSDRKKLYENPVFFEDMQRSSASSPLLIFDEIHKYRPWKNYIKGIYDTYKNDYRFLVLGSGRLDVYKKGGDSLAGRYFLFHLPPFTLGEMAFGVSEPVSLHDFFKHPDQFLKKGEKEFYDTWNRLSKFSGFPEPFISGSQRHFQLWSQTYQSQLIREDVRDLTEIKQLDAVEHLYTLLPGRVGSPLSMESLARDVQVSAPSIKLWLDTFDSLFLTFRLSPWSKRINRSLVREKKLYLYNFAVIESEGTRFENMVACELHRAVSFWNDGGLGQYSLHYVRNKEKEEVDFLIALKNKPLLLIECKKSDETPGKGLLNFQQQLKIPAVTLVPKRDLYRKKKTGNHYCYTLDAVRFLASLPGLPS